MDPITGLRDKSCTNWHDEIAIRLILLEETCRYGLFTALTFTVLRGGYEIFRSLDRGE